VVAVRTGHFWFNSHSHYLTVTIHDWRTECAHRSRATPSIPGKKNPTINFLIRDALFSGNKLQCWRVGGRKYTKNHVWPPIITIIIIIIIIIIMGDKICSFKLICSKCHRVNAFLPLFLIFTGIWSLAYLISYIWGDVNSVGNLVCYVLSSPALRRSLNK